MELNNIAVDAALENNASMRSTGQNSTALLLLQKLRLAADLLCDEYKTMDAENVAGGGEAGAIVIDQVDKHVMDVLELLREMFRMGIKAKNGIFGGSSEPSILRLLSEITLKSTFQEIMSLGNQVDSIFESDPRHLEMAWLMMALNDVASPQYIEIIRQNPNLAKDYYDPNASIILSDTLMKPFVNIIHDLETVYFDLDFRSYAEYIKRSQTMSILNSSTASVASINQTLSKPKANESLENLEEIGLASSPMPESNKSLDLAEQFGDLQVAPSTGDTQSLKGSARSTSPRKSSPLKDSMILPEETEHGPEDDEGAEGEGELTFPSLNINHEDEQDEEELEEIYSETSTSQTRTTEPYYSSSDLTLTSLSDDDQEEALTEDEPTPATITSTSTASDLGFFGFPVPGMLRHQSSLLQSAIGYIGHHIPHVNPPPIHDSIPGDFETIDRVAEKEKLCLSCYDSETELKICPISGLGRQHFRCHDCHKVIGIGDYPDARLCELSGFYFCPECHSDDKALSPALIINNWDFKKVPVSKTFHSVAGSDSRSKLYDLEKLNPDLFVYEGELQDIKLIRVKLSTLASSFMSCTAENRLEIVRRIWPREHLIETVNLYTIEDLCDARYGRLLDELKDWLKLIQNHVTNDCLECQKRKHRLKD